MLTAPPASRCGDADVVSPPPSACSPAVHAAEAATPAGLPALDAKAGGVAAAAPARAARADEETAFDGRDVLGAAEDEAAATVAAAVAAAICCIKFRLLLARLMPTEAAAAPLLTLTGAADAAGFFPRPDGTPTDPAGSPCAKPFCHKMNRVSSRRGDGDGDGDEKEAGREGSG